MKKLGLFIAIIFLMSFADDPIQYYPSMLKKELNQKFIKGSFEVKEFNATDSISKSVNYNGKYYYLYVGSSLINYLYVGRLNACKIEGCDINAGKSGKFEYFDYYILFTKDKKVESIRIYNYAASHGEQVCSKNWLAQFKGYNGELPLVVGRDIDGLSGATTSVSALTNDVYDKSVKLKTLVQ